MVFPWHRYENPSFRTFIFKSILYFTKAKYHSLAQMNDNVNVNNGLHTAFCSCQGNLG